MEERIGPVLKHVKKKFVFSCVFQRAEKAGFFPVFRVRMVKSHRANPRTPEESPHPRRIETANSTASHPDPCLVLPRILPGRGVSVSLNRFFSDFREPENFREKPRRPDAFGNFRKISKKFPFPGKNLRKVNVCKCQPQLGPVFSKGPYVYRQLLPFTFCQNEH